MKPTIIVCLLLAIAMSGKLGTGKACAKAEAKDGDKKSYVCFEQTGDDKYKMFTVCGNDTSANYFSVSEYKSKIRIKIGCQLYDDCGEETKYKYTNYRELLSEFSECLEYLSHKKDVPSLDDINFMLIDLADIAVEATNIYNKTFPHNKEYDPENVFWAISQTTLIDDFNDVLNKYGVEVDRLEYEDYCLFLAKKKYFLRTAVVSDVEKVPSRVMMVPMVLLLKKKAGANGTQMKGRRDSLNVNVPMQYR